MKEAVIRKKVVEILKGEGFVCWYPAKVRFKENDIFGVFDLVCCKGSKVRFIQLTTLSNIRARERKVNDFLLRTHSYLNAEIWGYDKKNKKFRIIKFSK